MKVRNTPNNERVANARRKAILSSWPIEKQLEALVEFHAGRPAKLEKLLKDMQSIRGKWKKTT